MFKNQTFTNIPIDPVHSYRHKSADINTLTKPFLPIPYLQISDINPFSTTIIMNAEIDNFIASNKVAIISKSYCPYCTKAKKAFQQAKIPFGSLEIENRKDCAQIQAYMKQKTGAQSVPRVFVNGNFIGGGDEVVAKMRSGELQKMCQ